MKLSKLLNLSDSQFWPNGHNVLVMVGCNRQLDTMEHPKDVRLDEGLSRLGWSVAVSRRGFISWGS